MKSYIVSSLTICSSFTNYCGCFKKCSGNKNKDKKKEEENKLINNKDLGVKKKKVNIKYKKKKIKFINGDEILKKICEKIKSKKYRIKLGKNENINKIEVTKYEKLQKYFSNDEHLKDLKPDEKDFIKKFIENKEDETEEEVETIIPYIEKNSNLGFIDENRIISEINKGYGSDVPDDKRELVKIVKEVIELLKNKNKETNSTEKNKNIQTILDKDSKNPLYVFGCRVFEGNLVDKIYELLFNFGAGDGCYQVQANKSNKKSSKNENVKIETIKNPTDNKKIANLSFTKHTTKTAIDIFHEVSNDFYNYTEDKDNEFTVYVDSDAKFKESTLGGHINIYVDIVYRCVYDETNKCTYFITLNSAHYEFLNKIEEWFDKSTAFFKNLFSGNKEENKKEAIGMYVTEIKEQNDENVKNIFNYIDEHIKNEE